VNFWTVAGGVVVAAATLITAVVLVFKARPEARKLKTDGTAALLSATTATSAELADQVAELQAETRRLWQAQRAQEQRITDHVRWDRKVVDTLRSLGGEITDPPPLYMEEAA
jgi:Tfp pilus assembly protein PilN